MGQLKNPINSGADPDQGLLMTSSNILHCRISQEIFQKPL